MNAQTQGGRSPVAGVVLTILGALLGLAALGLLAGGGAVLWVDHTQRDADGYLTTSSHRLATSSYAITQRGARIVGIPSALDPGKIAHIRIRAASADGRPVFVGIGSRRAVDGYLAGVPHSELRDFSPAPFTAHYHAVGGTSRPGPPAALKIWAASASGSTATLTWPVHEGTWSAVLMNADGSPRVAADVSFGAKIRYLGWLSAGLLGAGVLLLGLGVLFLVMGIRRLGDGSGPGAVPAAVSAPEAAPTEYPLALSAALDEPLSRGLWLIKWLLVVPHIFVLIFLWAGFVAATVGAWFAILFTGRYPRGLFEYNAGVLRWTWRVSYYAYGALGTDRYPPFSLGPEPDYPAALAIAYPDRDLSRKSTFFRLVLAFPQLLVVGVLAGGGSYWIDRFDHRHLTAGGGLIGLLVLIAGFALLFTKRYPRGLFGLVVGLDRWVARVVAYTALMTDEYPPFRLDQGGEEPQAQSM